MSGIIEREKMLTKKFKETLEYEGGLTIIHMLREHGFLIYILPMMNGYWHQRQGCII